MTTERLHPSGAIAVTELVTGDNLPLGHPRAWFETQTYYGYTVREARQMYRDHLREQGWTVAP